MHFIAGSEPLNHSSAEIRHVCIPNAIILHLPIFRAFRCRRLCGNVYFELRGWCAIIVQGRARRWLEWYSGSKCREIHSRVGSSIKCYRLIHLMQISKCRLLTWTVRSAKSRKKRLRIPRTDLSDNTRLTLFWCSYFFLRRTIRSFGGLYAVFYYNIKSTKYY